jgi:hypothetical protein
VRLCQLVIPLIQFAYNFVPFNHLTYYLDLFSIQQLGRISVLCMLLLFPSICFCQNLIDLAGSESSKTETTGLRRKEGSYINKSLLTLGTVRFPATCAPEDSLFVILLRN